jgi:hypothetical protein
MMKAVRFVTLGVFLVHSFWMNAGEILYKVSDIPKELKENARSVVRNFEQIFEVNSTSKGELKTTYAITILNKNGIDDANFKEVYSKFLTVTGIKGRVFDEYGVLIKKISADDIRDFSAISGFSIYEDTRVKFIDPEIRNYPFTVEYSYTETYNGLFQYPTWMPLMDYNISVVKSSFKAIVSKGLEFRYHDMNVPVQVSITTSDENKVYYWEVSNLKALEHEPYSPPFREIVPRVLMAPAEFEIEGYPGNASSWMSLGDWDYSLCEGRNVLTEETVSFLKGLIKGCNDDYSKIRKIYEYLQGKVRYVSIQVGIGGWQPIEASTVDRLSYGDCKALTNYMQSMLKAAGINSYQCDVLAGESAASLIESFPYYMFNHVFLCVPSGADTLWLECTNQHYPCGYISDFTDDRDVLLVDKGKSKIVHTKSYTLEDNCESSLSQVTLDESGTGTLQINSVYRGLNYDDILPTYLADDTDKRKMISENLNFPGFQVVNYNYKENRDIIPSIEESLKINFENYLTKLNANYLLLLNCTNRIKGTPANVGNRKTELVSRHAYQDIDTIIYTLPSSLKVESVPAPVNIKTPFGEYSSKTELKGDLLTFVRNFRINKGRYPAASYADFIDFYDKIVVADDLKCVLVKK